MDSCFMCDGGPVIVLRDERISQDRYCFECGREFRVVGDFAIQHNGGNDA